MTARRAAVVLYCADLSAPGGSYRHRDAVAEGMTALGRDVLVVDGIVRPLRRLRRAPGRTGAPRALFRAMATTALLLNTVLSTVALIVRCVRARPDVVLWRPGLFQIHGAVAAAACGLPLVVEVNAPLALEASGRYSALGLAARIESWVLRQARSIIAVSAEAGRLAGAADPEVVPNGGGYASAREAADAASWPCPVCADASGAKHAIVLESFRRWHGDEQRRAVVAGLPPGWRVLVIGDGPGRPAFESWVSGRGLHRTVSCMGSLPPAAVQHVLAEHADLGLVLYPPLARFYFSPLKLYDFLAHGIPVVATALPDDTRLIAAVRDGLIQLVAPGDHAELADAVRFSPPRRPHPPDAVLGSPFGWAHASRRYVSVLDHTAPAGIPVRSTERERAA